MATDKSNGASKGAAKKSAASKAAPKTVSSMTASSVAPASPAAAAPATARKSAAKKSVRKASSAEASLPPANPAEKLAAAAKPSKPKAVARAATSPSSQRKTTILVKANVGFGNSIYLRGNGPGLSWDVGVQAENLSADEWRWVTTESNAEFEVKVLLNDNVWEVGPNTTIASGSKTVIEPSFE